VLTQGYVSIPIYNGKEISAEEYESLEAEVKKDIEERSQKIQEKVVEFIRQIQQFEKKVKEKIKNLQDKMTLFAIGHLIKNLQDKYSDNPELVNYFIDVQKDVLYNLDNFVASDNELGVFTTDYMRIKALALHKANGGYLVLQAKDVLTSTFAWEGLKRSLKTREVNIEDLRDQFGLVTISSLKPEPVKINLKVILLGHPFIYHILYDRDEDFRKLFKIKADFDLEMNLNNIHMEQMAAFISSHCQQENLKHFDRTGIAKVIEYSTRLAGNQEKLTTRFNELSEILYEADAYAALENAQYVSGKHVDQAINEKKYRSNRYEEKIQEMIDQGKILISTEGKVIGQINGLAVINLGDYTFGKPNRITAVIYMGRSGVINIERETRMSGNIHDKGILILSGFLGEKFTQENPLALSASLTFEQLYGEVEGDSASSTELYALLSSLADVPINQGIAVTGSVNQKGEIQPVGGVTEKIEGFFAVCKKKGLTGEQGVIIPKQNISDIVLDDEVILAVQEEKFHIYAIENIDQGIEILMGIPAGEKDEFGRYPEGTLNYLVDNKLKTYLKSFLRTRNELTSEETYK